ncbi:Kelch repeat-containing protein [Mycobacterium sp.]
MAEESLPTASWALAAAVCQAPGSESGEWVYAIGGIGDGNVLAAVAGYDTVQQRWFARPSMPTPRSGLAAATSPGRVHVLGGSSANADFLTTHEVYEPANDAWSKAAPLPTPRGTLAAATGPDGLIYAIGGSDANNVLATVEAYDLAADKWIARAPLQTPRGWVATVTGHDGLIYAIGGATGTTITNSMEIFNVTTDTWTTSPYTLPAPTCGLAAAVDPNGLIYAIGGDNLVNNTSIPSPNVYGYNPASPGWTAQPSLSAARVCLAAATGPDGLIYAIGGADPNSPTSGLLASVEAYTSDKCYPIVQKIAVVQNNISNAASNLGDLPPQARAGAERELAGLRAQLISLEAQLKTCRGG